MNEIQAWTEYVSIIHDDAQKEVKVGLQNGKYEAFYEDYQLNPLFYLENAPATTLYLILNNEDPINFYSLFFQEIMKIKDLPYISQKVEEYIDLYNEIRTRPKHDKKEKGTMIGLKVYKDGDTVGDMELTPKQFIDLTANVVQKNSVHLYYKYNIIMALKEMDIPEVHNNKFKFHYSSKIIREFSIGKMESKDTRLLDFIAKVGSKILTSEVTLFAFFLENLKLFYYEDFCSIKGLRADIVAKTLSQYIDNRFSYDDVIINCSEKKSAIMALEFVASYDTISGNVGLSDRVLDFIESYKKFEREL